MSSNPFRKKNLESVEPPRAQSPYKSSLRSESPVGGGATPGKPKSVKKVRVLSPPPLSPDSPEWMADASWGTSDGSHQAAHAYTGAPVPGVSFRENVETASVPAVGLGVNTLRTAPPANPFSRTLQDLEGSDELQSQKKSEGAALKAGNAASQSLNVDSFKRLLLTGKANDTDLLESTNLAAEDEAIRKAIAPVNQILQESRTADRPGTNDDRDREQTPSPSDSSFDGSDNEIEPQATEKKPPPPPPSSRHGRSLRDEGLDATKLAASTDVNKPLPPSPIRTSTDGSESPFDLESAGKIPESQPAASPELDRGPTVPPSSVKRPAPLPPPRRGHGRAESRGQLSAELTPSRYLGEETSTRLEDSRTGGHGPAPPPPPRPHASSRQTSAVSQDAASPGPAVDLSSPLLDSEANFQDPVARDFGVSGVRQDASATPKTGAAPPRPPTRNPSVKRPPSMHSVEGISRRVSVEKKARDGSTRPPPPPPRQRGGSSSSLDTSRMTALEGPSPSAATKMAASSEQLGGSSSQDDVDILADLDALQREVDALRGKIG